MRNIPAVYCTGAASYGGGSKGPPMPTAFGALGLARGPLGGSMGGGAQNNYLAASMRRWQGQTQPGYAAAPYMGRYTAPWTYH